MSRGRPDKGWLLAQMLAHHDPGAFFGQFFRAAVDRWISGRYDAEYDEPWPQFQARVQRALQQTCAALDKRDHVVVFTSGGCIAAVTQRLLGLTDVATFGVNLTLANAGLTRIRAGQDGLLLLTLNDHSHFFRAPQAVADVSLIVSPSDLTPVPASPLTHQSRR
jgi:broad specificity phosphatase PhoE